MQQQWRGINVFSVGKDDESDKVTESFQRDIDSYENRYNNNWNEELNTFNSTTQFERRMWELWNGLSFLFYLQPLKNKFSPCYEQKIGIYLFNLGKNVLVNSMPSVRLISNIQQWWNRPLWKCNDFNCSGTNSATLNIKQ